MHVTKVFDNVAFRSKHASLACLLRNGREYIVFIKIVEVDENNDLS